jgi:hypothetical protein
MDPKGRRFPCTTRIMANQSSVTFLGKTSVRVHDDTHGGYQRMGYCCEQSFGVSVLFRPPIIIGAAVQATCRFFSGTFCVGSHTGTVTNRITITAISFFWQSFFFVTLYHERLCSECNGDGIRSISSWQSVRRLFQRTAKPRPWTQEAKRVLSRKKSDVIIRSTLGNFIGSRAASSSQVVDDEEILRSS